MSSPRVYTAVEIARHNTAADCWVIIKGLVYNLSSFLAEHPAGATVILKHAGQDATQAFEPFHSSDVVSKLGLDHLVIGTLDPKDANAGTSAVAGTAPVAASTTLPSPPSAGAVVPWTKPPLDHMLNAFDFEVVAKHTMAPAGWDYYSSGADDEITLRENHSAFQRIWLRPRILVDVSVIDTRTTLLGCATTMPVGCHLKTA